MINFVVLEIFMKVQLRMAQQRLSCHFIVLLDHPGIKKIITFNISSSFNFLPKILLLIEQTFSILRGGQRLGKARGSSSLARRSGGSEATK